jgi:signal transduction histidine kinase
MEELKNPLKINMTASLIGALAGVCLILVPMLITAISLYQFYFVYFGIIVIIFALGMFMFYRKRSRQFTEFIARKDQLLNWEYEEVQYTEFIGELNQLQRASNKKRIGILLLIIVAVSVVLFFLLSDDVRWLSVVFFGFFAVTSLLVTIVLPESFKYRAMIKPYITIIGQDEAYIMGRFHKWTKARAKIKNYDNGSQIYKVLAINYEAITRNGKMFQEWTAVIPDPKNQEMLLEAKRWVNRINKLSDENEAQKKEQKSWLERQFQKMTGKSKKDN